MPVIQGSVQSDKGNRLVAIFIIGGTTYTFSGNFSPYLSSKFISGNATLTYNDTSQLIQTDPHSRPFYGVAGQDDITINLPDGVSITGSLPNPISPASNISGSGIWTTY